MKRCLAAAFAICSILVLATPASAAGPTRDPAPQSTVPLPGVCGFDVTLTFPINNQYALTFTDSAGHVTTQIITGHLTVVFTRDGTSKSLSSNFSGPAVLTFYPSATTAFGPPKDFQFMGPQGGPLNGGLTAGAGRTEFVFAPDGTVTDFSQVGHYTDVCAALA